MTFESIVRPFAKKEVLATRRIIPSVSVMPDPPPTAILSWGSVGMIESGVKQDDGADLGLGFKVVHTETWKEKSRKTQDFRVANPDNPDQYVTERRTTRSNFSRGPATETSVTTSSTSYSTATTVSPYPDPIKGSNEIPVNQVDNTQYHYLVDDPGTPV